MICSTPRYFVTDIDYNFFNIIAWMNTNHEFVIVNMLIFLPLTN